MLVDSKFDSKGESRAHLLAINADWKNNNLTLVNINEIEPYLSRSSCRASQNDMNICQAGNTHHRSNMAGCTQLKW